MRKSFQQLIVASLAGILLAAGLSAQARGGARQSVSAQNVNRNTTNNVNRNTNVNQNANVNRNVNVNQNVNVNRNVNVNVNNSYHGGGGYYGGGCCYHPVATAAAVTATAMVTAAVVGSMVNTLPPSCATVMVGGIAYSQCGSTWYQPQFAGGNTTYVVVNAPR